MIKWQWVLFDELSLNELYDIMKVRQAVFTVEQDCAYQDADGLDQFSWHLVGWHEHSGEQKVAAYLRVVFPDKKYPEPSIGRVLTAEQARGTGLGKVLIREAITHVVDEYPDAAVRISAQQHLEKFYSEFGFKTVSEPYDEDGIPHIEMLRQK
ncbi:MAG: GNAT family N-acetyltransferase [Oleispira antarctica]|nr:GNAT family N-acetyltransferase [Oleispira antarctica]MBQ0791437.1 GNAT family N-acetyltransferase [Oleispira antarctica]